MESLDITKCLYIVSISKVSLSSGFSVIFKLGWKPFPKPNKSAEVGRQVITSILAEYEEFLTVCECEDNTTECSCIISSEAQLIHYLSLLTRVDREVLDTLATMKYLGQNIESCVDQYAIDAYKKFT